MNAVTDQPKITALSFASLPALGAELDGGTFQGICTQTDGQHVAVIYLGHADKDRDHKGQIAEAESRGCVLATRLIFNLLLVTLATPLPSNWYWASEVYGSSFAWYCYSYGGQFTFNRSAEGGAVFVRLIPLTF